MTGIMTPRKRGRPGDRIVLVGRHRLARRRASALVLLCAVSMVCIETVASARPPNGPAVLTAADFHPVVVGAVPRPESTSSVAITQVEPLAPLRDFATAERSFAPRPTPDQPNTARVQVKTKPLRLTGKHASGSATWYCKAGVSACHSQFPSGMYAAAGPALRVGDWRGRRVQVCSGGNCVVVTLVDWCACGGSHIIDLYSGAFQRLAPLSSGAVQVTVRW
jgi:rare lipoprotein A (peptidoglycan hydrolase)